MKYTVSGFLLLTCMGVFPVQSLACGGFFCQIVPINQAAEQIVFRQQGDQTTAMVRILYQGDAEDFSWVVPVPARPELSIGSDQTFIELDFATRPTFNLETTGQSCDQDFATTAGTTDGAVFESVADSDEDGIMVEDLSVGPFDVQIVSSDNPDELALWLEDNEYDLSDNGRNLIAPYVNDGMQFVALKLRSGESAGSIQPLIMTYTNDKPTIPIRLTAVAAEEDMGVLVWIVGDARAVPENYLHVTPNYTQLNWYAGSANAYGSYQTLITAAMDEAGGQGFATDMAGPIDEMLLNRLSSAAPLEQFLVEVDALSSNAEFISRVAGRATSDRFLNQLRSDLPLPDGQDDAAYYNFASLEVLFTGDELATARPLVREHFVETEVSPLQESIAQIPEGEYLTRLYTTLSADEMTLDPFFSYNADMPAQAQTREALMELSCGDNGTQWSLTLGAGTGREGETVIVANQPTPFSPPPEVTQQEATWLIERTSGDADPEVTRKNDFAVLAINTSMSEDDDDGGFLGAAGAAWLMLLIATAGLRFRKRL
ncbi:MAG: DUF2330 domain-containing protein [Granulosicoccus sp.]|nr:DUF2330 domain-containing protein [Granulosicoccus sp.]